MTQDSLRPLTSLRFFAVLWIVLSSYLNDLEGRLHIGLIDKGYLGLDGAFILIGFLLSHAGFDVFPGNRRRGPLHDRPVLAVALACLVVTAAYLIFDRLFVDRVAALRFLPCALLGSALHLAWRAGAVARPATATAAAAIASLTVIVASSLARPDIVIVLALGLLVLAFAGLGRDREGRENGILSSRLMVYLGEISFAIYLSHGPWLSLWRSGVNALMGTDHQPLPLYWWLAGLLGLIPLAMLVHRLVEQPLRHIWRNWEEVLRHKIVYQWAK